MESSADGLKLAAEVFVTALIITIVIFVVVSARRSLQSSVFAIEQTVNRNDQGRLQSYDGSIVMGDSVKHVISKLDGGQFVRVVTKRCPYGFTSFDGIRDPGSDEFIGNTYRFMASAMYDQQGECIGVEFREDGALTDARLTASLLAELRDRRDLLKEVAGS